MATEDTLSSAGAGLSFAWGKSFSGRAMVALPVSSPPDELDQRSLHFQIVWHAI